jgi:hypothetical protein
VRKPIPDPGRAPDRANIEVEMMRTLLCRLFGRHRPALVVVGYTDDHPITASSCPHCGRVQTLA